MATKKENNNEFEKMTYQQLEEESDKILNQLSDDSLPLDERAKLFYQGKKLYAEMEKRLEELQKNVKDTIEN